MVTTLTESFSVPSSIPVIELIDVHTAFDSEWVLKGVNFGVQPGRITCLLGPSGVGKTTCLRHVTGLLAPDQGDVLIEGESTFSMRKAKRMELAKRFGVLLQGSGLYGSALWESMSVEENMIHQLRLSRDWDDEKAMARSQDWLGAVGLAGCAAMTPSELSAGMRRRVGLARALVGEPEFAVLDSFELGVDAVRLGQLCDLISRSHERGGGTYLIATQSMEVAKRLAHDIVMLYEGRVIEQAPVMDVFDSDKPEVRQFVAGATEGPLAMGGDRGAHPSRPRPSLNSLRAPKRLGEEDFEMPIPLVAISFMVVLTAAGLVLGARTTLWITLMIVMWVVTLGFLALRRVYDDDD